MLETGRVKVKTGQRVTNANKHHQHLSTNKSTSRDITYCILYYGFRCGHRDNCLCPQFRYDIVQFFVLVKLTWWMWHFCTTYTSRNGSR